MVVYLALEFISEQFRNQNVLEQITLTKNYITIGNAPNNDFFIPLKDIEPAYFAISKNEDNNYVIIPNRLTILINDRPISQPFTLAHKDRIAIADDYIFCFIQINRLSSPKESEDIGNKTAMMKFPSGLSHPPSDMVGQETSVRYKSQKSKTSTQRINIIKPSSSDSNTTPKVEKTEPPSTSKSKELLSTAAQKLAKSPNIVPSKIGDYPTNSSSIGTTQKFVPITKPTQQNIPTTIADVINLGAQPDVPTTRLDMQMANSSETVRINKSALPSSPTSPLQSSLQPSETVKIVKSSLPATISPIQEKNEKIARMIRSEVEPADQISSKTPSDFSKEISSSKKSQEIQNIFESPSEMEMTLLWENRVETAQLVPQLISPPNGQIIEINKNRFIIGRSSTCDLCLRDDYISRQQLELSKIPLGFLAKNIGKNDVIIEKKSAQSISPDGKTILEEKILKPGESAILSQEATIILGNQIIYFFNIPESAEKHTATSGRERKYKFYKNLANQKAELLDAAQLQKLLTPSCNIFDDIKIGIWFKYLAINDLSGDFFLYHKTKDVLYVCLGDVSGHGATAALLASQISGMFKILAEQLKSAEEIVLAMNQHLLTLKKQKSYQSLYALVNVLLITRHGVEVCIAGNSVPPLWWQANNKKLVSLDTPATPVGLFEGEKFKTYWDAISFQNDDMLIMFTDGVTEAEMSDDTFLEYTRVQNQIESQIAQHQPWEEFLDNFLVWLKQQSEIRDDLSIVLLGKTGGISWKKNVQS